MLRSDDKAAHALATALDGALVERPAPGDGGADLTIRARPGDRPIRLQVKWLTHGSPSALHRVVGNAPQPWPPALVVASDRFSRGAIAWLEERNANWVEATGRARILGPDGLIAIRDTPRLQAPAAAFTWSPSALSIAETVLTQPLASLRGADVAERSGWSPARVAKVLKGFDGQGWTEKRGGERGRGARRLLVDPDGLLDAWAAAIGERPRHRRLAHRATRDAMGLLAEQLAPALAHQRVPWALSGWGALELAAPFMTAVPSLQLYVHRDRFAGPLTEAIEDAGLREVGEGARVVLWMGDDHLFGNVASLDGQPVVSPPRLYADLGQLGARGVDAAQHLKQELVDPRFREVRRAADEDRDGRASRRD